MFKYSEIHKSHLLKIAEFSDLFAASFAASDKPVSDVANLDLLNKANVFFNWYIDYVNFALKDKEYNDKQIAQCIYQTNIKSLNQSKEYLLKCLYISREYVKMLRDNAKQETILNYSKTLITDLLIDLEWLICQFEVINRKTVKRVVITSQRRKDLSPMDLYLAATSLFCIEEKTNIYELPLRDIKPAVIFQIRQLLEVFGRNLLGYHEIQDLQGNTIKKFTQISWEFISKELKTENPRITFPFDIQTILSINQWANSFVHTTFIYNSYIQHFTLVFLKVLFASPTDGLTIYDGQKIKKFQIADIGITDYNTLKTDFESFLNERAGVKVIWNDLDSVGAYILSL